MPSQFEILQFGQKFGEEVASEAAKFGMDLSMQALATAIASALKTAEIKGIPSEATRKAAVQEYVSRLRQYS